jgi:ectoine hydroxylase-related dioxygenase (phytanoyl-CoA dioxygenase family)
MVWPGSHRKLEKLAKSEPTHYQMMSTLNLELGRVDLGYPRELTPPCGDVLFYHYLCAHSGTMNTSDRARLALNVKW